MPVLLVQLPQLYQYSHVVDSARARAHVHVPNAHCSMLAEAVTSVTTVAEKALFKQPCITNYCEMLGSSNALQ